MERYIQLGRARFARQQLVRAKRAEIHHRHRRRREVGVRCRHEPAVQVQTNPAARSTPRVQIQAEYQGIRRVEVHRGRMIQPIRPGHCYSPVAAATELSKASLSDHYAEAVLLKSTG